ncbi:zinc finger and BTB domain-containing protein 12-like [Alosa sapidissima]|uniref:zinc finger and BTB domain-containing protein 12-like n=1 Tax=Alosa sapidissima TaxID=34773 RepID=UPI001C090BD2|nr:zinc finger and BTB domain-containing protein 12-like [Alosa sapidissima]XP_041936895.1 zinc finger and BTB domain-containing protein 12-like [Alosa sapidissima]XP_041936898.1 zinc finger and BTB domain-containing protein 12-like [Alosa sapidissima]XP_041936899.1 zinc finger and BTB domain-containing protein 12-like [Alosa sapidissima]XP_041937431.1 zinc finger and BTB domain-containing protein 12-like [Alosa sapidissima]XP_041937432.1 zinc finger and BTB domain-containing protein 12-like [
MDDSSMDDSGMYTSGGESQATTILFSRSEGDFVSPSEFEDDGHSPLPSPPPPPPPPSPPPQGLLPRQPRLWLENDMDGYLGDEEDSDEDDNL